MTETFLYIWKNKRSSERHQRYPTGGIYLNEIDINSALVSDCFVSQYEQQFPRIKEVKSFKMQG